MFNLFLVFLQVGLFSFGGGYAALPIIQNELIYTQKWMSIIEFSDMVTISQMTPGPLAINAATFVGMKQKGVIGAIISTYALVIPSIILCMIMSYFYYKYRNLNSVDKVLKVLRGSVIGLIFMGGIQLIVPALFEDVQISSFVIFIVTLILILKYKLDSIYAIIISGFLGLILFYLF